MDDPHDFFTNPALRTRLSRFQNPFNSMFGQRKRRTSPPSSAGAAEPQHTTHRDPYHDDFFQSHFDAPHWNEPPRGWPPMNGARMRKPEERTGGGVKTNADMFNYIPEEFRQYMPEKFGFAHHPPPHRSTTQSQAQPQTPQQQQQHQQPQKPYTQSTSSGDLRRPKFCDAGMQTDDVSPSESASNLNENEPRAEQPPRGNTPQGAAEPQAQQQQQQQPPQSGQARSFADTGVGNSPNSSFASANAYASTGDGNGQRQARSNSNSMGNVRRVPIVVEGGASSFPKESHMPHRSPPNRQSTESPQPQQRAPNRPPPPTAREVPIQRPVEPPSPSVVSINKIQDIQQDVLDLMFKVEQYAGGNKADKEYKYLDEMLTRNLLKLDTIDTRGNDSIRLARKEAIKCIQASLSVLEAKLDDGRPKESEQDKAEAAVEESASAAAVEKCEIEGSVAAQDQVDKSKIPIPLPGIPGQVPAPFIRDCNSDEEGDSPVFVSNKTVELKPSNV